MKADRLNTIVGGLVNQTGEPVPMSTIISEAANLDPHVKVETTRESGSTFYELTFDDESSVKYGVDDKE